MPFVAHNAQAEYKWYLSRGLDPNIIHDSMLASYLYDERLPLGLESLCMEFDIDKAYKPEDTFALKGKKLEKHNSRDARNCLLLIDEVWPLLTEEEKKIYFEVLMPATKTLAQIELEGIRVNMKRYERVIKEIEKRIKEIKLEGDAVIRRFNKNSDKPFNIRSPDHKKIVIFDMLGYAPVAYTDTNEPSTKADYLEYMLRRKPNKTLEKIWKASQYYGWLRTLNKTLPKHIVEVDGKHIIFASFNQGATGTGRIMSNKPNLQNQTKDDLFRSIYIPKENGGWFLEWDYDQIELRIMAGASGDEKLIETFVSGKDPHAETGKDIFGSKKVSEKERDNAKTFNYGLIYGAGPKLLALQTGSSVEDVKKMFKRFWKEHPKLRDFLDNTPQHGIVKSLTGMKRHCETWMQGLNFQVQNPALIIHLMALNEFAPEMKKRDAPVIIPVHDSMLQDLTKKPNRAIIKIGKEILESKNFDWMPIPLTVSYKIGKHWGAMRKMK
jgi:DNA polymerase-1